MEGESPDDADLEFPNIMDLLEDIDDTEQQEAKKNEKQTKVLFVCALCGKEFRGIWRLLSHLHYCTNNTIMSK